MVTKSKKTTNQKTADPVRDLPALKDPKGGAQKKEGQNSSTRGGGMAQKTKSWRRFPLPNEQRSCFRPL